MIVHFPNLEDEETFYNGCATYGERIPWSTNTSVRMELFGVGVMRNIEAIPSRLGYFVQNLPLEMRIPIKKIIESHTIVPFFTPFLTAESASQLYSEIAGDSVETYAARLHGSAALSSFLRYCPICVEQDRKRVGRAYWRRVHQLGAVRVCPIHHAFLHDSQVLRGEQTKHSYISAESSITACDRAKFAREGDPWHDLQLWIANQCQWILQNPGISIDQQNLVSCYRRLIETAGFTGVGTTRVIGFVRAFQSAFPGEWLKELRCFPNFDTQRVTWIHNALSRGNGNTIQHLLIIRLLGLDFQQFIEKVSRTVVKPNSQSSVRAEFEHSTAKANVSVRDSYRRVVIKTIVANPEATRTELRQSLANAEMCWLGRHDPDWLYSVLPARKKPMQVPRKSSKDWAERDRLLSSKVPEVRSNILSDPGRPVRITKQRLVLGLGFRQGVLPDKLPMTSRAVNAELESEKSFSLRRLLWLAANSTWTLRRRNLSRIIDRAKVRDEWRELPEFKAAISRAGEILQGAFFPQQNLNGDEAERLIA